MKKLDNLYDPVELYGDKSWIVSTVCKKDLESDIYQDYLKGKMLTDEEMSRLVEKMANSMSECYWNSLESALEYITSDRDNK